MTIADRERVAWVIDDEPAIQTMLIDLFRTIGMKAIAFDGGDALLRFLEADFATPEIASVDVMMPGASGFSLIRSMRARPRLARIPMIVLSARCEVGDAALAAKLGAAFLAKPFRVGQYIATVEHLIEFSQPVPVVGR